MLLKFKLNKKMAYGCETVLWLGAETGLDVAPVSGLFGGSYELYFLKRVQRARGVSHRGLFPSKLGINETDELHKYE